MVLRAPCSLLSNPTLQITPIQYNFRKINKPLNIELMPSNNEEQNAEEHLINCVSNTSYQ